MSEVETEIESAPPTGGVTASGLSALRLVANWAIAAVSLAVIAGFVYWTVNLGTRDPHEVPIIRAMEGPSRVAPDDPGGRKASHQGLAVNAVQSDGSVEAPAREVVLAPEPDQLSDDDPTLGSTKTVASDEATKKPVQTAEADPEQKEPKSEADLDALEIVDKVAEAAAEQDQANADPSLVPVRKIGGTKFSPKTSLRPQGRPSALATQVTDVERTASVEPVANAVESVPIGTRLIQLGAYDSAELAQTEWAKLVDKHADLLEEKKRLVVEAESGGRKFYRLRAVGFNSLDESRNLCSALLARGTPCIPVTAR